MHWMAMAIELAQAHRPSPNPRVGAVVVADGEVVGVGAHEQAGSAHAEVIALAAAGERARGADLFVTLEPCAHTGRTGPCVAAIIASGISRVVYATSDPNPVAAGGAELLRRAGIAVEGGVLADRAHDLNRGWFHSLQTGRPHVTWKMAATLDGRTAAVDGSSKWITGTAARADVQRLRAEVDAIITGTGTVLADNPRLDVRDRGDIRQPLAVVIGDRAIPADFHLAGRALRFPQQDPSTVLKELHDQGVLSVLLECGPTLAGAFMRAGAIDRGVLYLAPKLLGDGAGLLGSLGIESISDARRLRIVDSTVVGDDVRITWEA